MRKQYPWLAQICFSLFSCPCWDSECRPPKFSPLPPIPHGSAPVCSGSSSSCNIRLATPYAVNPQLGSTHAQITIFYGAGGLLLLFHHNPLYVVRSFHPNSKSAVGDNARNDRTAVRSPPVAVNKTSTPKSKQGSYTCMTPTAFLSMDKVLSLADTSLYVLLLYSASTCNLWYSRAVLTKLSAFGIHWHVCHKTFRMPQIKTAKY